MSKISRRNFIKGAGVAALAVAAAGMLAGCGSSAPEMVDVTVKYTKLNTLLSRYDTIGKEGEYDETISVVKGQKTIKKEQLKNLGSVCKNSGYSAEKARRKLKSTGWARLRSLRSSCLSSNIKRSRRIEAKRR